MRSILQCWREHWFSPTPPAQLAFVRIGFFAVLFILAVRQPLAATLSSYPASFWKPVWLIAHAVATPPPYALVRALELLWDVALFTSAIGLATRPSTIAAALLTLFFLGLQNSFGTVSHGRTPVALATLVLALAACGDAWSVDAWLRHRRKTAALASPRYHWPQQLLRLIWCLVFVSAGISKLVKSGFAWAFSGNLATMLLVAPHRYPEAAAASLVPGLGVWIAQRPLLCMALALGALMLELLAPLALLDRPWARVVVALMAGLQVGIYLTMFENFVWLLPMYVAWLTSAKALRNNLDRRRATPELVTRLEVPA